MECPHRDQLARDVAETLRHIVSLTQQEVVAINGNRASFYTLDRELEMAVGEKERRIGALRQHEREHGCL